jgi:hypothetical protein
MADYTQYGIREVCDLTFYELNDDGSKGAKVFAIDTAKTSTLEGASTTVYAQGGKGNPRLIAWEGEKTLTFTVEDALISKEGLELLTGNDVSEQDNEITIEADKFAGYYYVTAESLMRKKDNGKDYPLHIVLPRVKVQSNFSISMAPTGDPSTFSYVMDAFPGKIEGKGKEVLCQMTIDTVSADAVNPIKDFTASYSANVITLAKSGGVGEITADKVQATVVSGDATIGEITASTIAVTPGAEQSIIKVMIDGIEKYVVVAA